MPPYNNSHNMKQPKREKPTAEELKALYEKIVKHNLDRVKLKGSNAGPGPFAKAAIKNECTAMAVKKMFNPSKGVANWKKKHFAIYDYLLKSVKSMK